MTTELQNNPTDKIKTEYQSKYKWSTWFKKDVFVLEKGIDFDIGMGSMHQQIRNNATQRKLKVSIHECSKGFIVQVTKREDRDR